MQKHTTINLRSTCSQFRFVEINLKMSISDRMRVLITLRALFRQRMRMRMIRFINGKSNPLMDVNGIDEMREKKEVVNYRQVII